ncbi:MAG: ferredoxin [Mycobacterium sp.]
MRAEVDHGKCAGIGMCEMTAPGIFEVGDDGQAHVIPEEIDEADRAVAEDAVSSCPASALSMRS